MCCTKYDKCFGHPYGGRGYSQNTAECNDCIYYGACHEIYLYDLKIERMSKKHIRILDKLLSEARKGDPSDILDYKDSVM